MMYLLLFPLQCVIFSFDFIGLLLSLHETSSYITENHSRAFYLLNTGRSLEMLNVVTMNVYGAISYLTTI